MELIPVLDQAGPCCCLALPDTGGLQGKSSPSGASRLCPEQPVRGRGDTRSHQDLLGHHPRPGSAHPLTRAWVVGKGCRSRGFGSLGIRSSGSTLTCEKQAVRHSQGVPRPSVVIPPQQRCWCPPCPGAGSGWKAQARGSELGWGGTTESQDSVCVGMGMAPFQLRSSAALRDWRWGQVRGESKGLGKAGPA